MSAATKPTWPEACAPTAAEWRAWFLENDEAGQLEIAERAISFWADYMDCLALHGGPNA